MRAAIAVAWVAMIGFFGGVVLEEQPAKQLPFAISRETTGIVGPLREDGTVDYAQAMNEKYGKGVKADENGYVGMMEIFGTQGVARKVKGRLFELSGLRDSDGLQAKGYREFLREKRGELTWEQHLQMIQAGRRMWAAEDFPQVAEYLASQEKVLEKSRDAFSRPKWWLPNATDASGDLNSVQVAGIDPIGGIIEALGAQAMLRLKGGDFDAFMVNVAALENLAKGMQKGGRMTERNTGYLADTTAMEAVSGAAGSGDLTADQCVKLWRWIDALSEPTGPEESFDLNQRWTMLERACLVATGKAAGWMPALGKIDAAQVRWNAALRRMNAVMDERMAAIKKATPRELAEMEQKRWNDREEQAKENLSKRSDETAEDYTERVALNLSGPVYHGGWAGAEERYREAVLKRKMGRVILGLAAYRAEKGSWPDSLATLKPAYLKEIPLDPYSDHGAEEIRYRHGNGAWVYSVGTNGKDDGGANVYERSSQGDDIVVGVRSAPVDVEK